MVVEEQTNERESVRTTEHEHAQMDGRSDRLLHGEMYVALLLGSLGLSHVGGELQKKSAEFRKEVV